MCYKGKCMHCLEVETGALIFAILNVMATSLGSVFSVGGLVYTSFMTEAVIHRADEIGDERLAAGALVMGLAANVVFAVLAVAFCISFSFAVVLMVGICKRKAHLVKCYFVYGVVKIVFGVAGMIGLARDSDNIPIILALLIAYSIYSLILVMVRLTFKKFQSEVAYNTFSNPISVIQKF